MDDRADYLGQAFMEDSQIHVVSAEFKKKPYCTFLLEGKKKTAEERKCVNGGKGDGSLESNQTKDTLLIASSKTRGRKLV